MMKHVPLKVWIFAVALLVLSAADATARTITLAWEGSPDTTAVGYRVFWSTQSGAYNDTDYFEAGASLTWTGELPGDQYYFVVRAYDADGTLGPPSLEVGDTNAFWLTNPGDQLSETGQAVAVPLLAHGAPVTYNADGLPLGLGLDPLTGQIFGAVTVAVDAPTAQLVTARAVDATGHVSSVQFYWTIRTNHPPNVTNPGAQTTLGGDAVALSISAYDSDGQSLTYWATNLPPGVAIDSGTGLISGRTLPTTAGLFNVSVAVSDGRLTTVVDFSWQIWAGDAPTVVRVISAEAVGSTVTTAPFVTAVADETLVVFVEAAQPTNAGAQTAVVSGGGLVWSLVARANGQTGTAEIWSARAPAQLSELSVTADTSIGGAFLSLTVVGFAGADGVGASAAASAPSGAPAVSLVTTRAGSLVFGAGNDWDGSVPRTTPPGQELVHEALTDAGDTFWVQRLTAAIAAAGTPVTLTDVAPTDHQWNFAAVEILARPPATVMPSLSIDDVSMPEGSVGSSPMIVTVRLSLASSVPVSVSYATADGTANAGTDYIAQSGTLVFPPGTTTQTIAVAIVGDSSVESAESFTVVLSGAVNATLADAQGLGTISDDDVVAPAQMNIDDVAMPEGSVGSSSLIFTVSLSPASSVPVSVSYATVDGTAKAGTDYIAKSGTLVFPPGTTTQTIAVAIVGDAAVESAESFRVVLSGAVNATLADAQGLGTISNDDAAAPPQTNEVFGFGALTDGRIGNLFVFRVAEGKKADYSRLEFWSSEPTKVKGKGKDKDKHLDDDDRQGCDDSDYARDHRAAKNRFETTTISTKVFGPLAKKGGSVTFSGAGLWNGKSGFTFEARAVDLGEPGRGHDTFSLIVKDKKGTVVLSISDTIDLGNIQAKGSKH